MQAPEADAVPGAVIAIQTFGDFLNFNPHCHVLCTDGSFFPNGACKVDAAWDAQGLEKLFQHKVLSMLLRKGKIIEEVVEIILSWRHSGFNVHCGPRIQPGDEEALENIARYVVRASFSQERMTYVPERPKTS
ncbi:MAG: transposase [Deltaproteobacteria bacterium]|nr:transposase [Deltaproteobacteria bacterium]